MACKVLAIEIPCWRCKKRSTAVVGILRSEVRSADMVGCFVPFESCSDLIASMLPDTILAEKNVGKLKPRYSKTLKKSYVSNGCRHCDAIFGNFPLSETLGEYFSDMGGQDYSKVPIITTVHIPKEIVSKWEAWD